MRRSAPKSARLDLEHLDPPEAIERLIAFTWNYFPPQPGIPRAAQHRESASARSTSSAPPKVKSMHSPFVEMIRTVVLRGVASRAISSVAMDPVQLYISIAALCFFYLGNNATLSVIFGRDLLEKEARDERLGAYGGAGAGGAAPGRSVRRIPAARRRTGCPHPVSPKRLKPLRVDFR